MKKLWKHIKKISGQKNKLLYQIFFSLVILSLFLILVMGIWMNDIIARNQRKEIAQADISRLEQAGESMATLMDVLGQNMTQIMWSSDTTTYLVLPDEGESEKEYRIIRQLSSATDSSELVTKVFFYSYLADKILDSSSVVSTASEYEDWQLINEHYEGVQITGRVSAARVITTLIYYQERLFLVQDLEIPNRIGTLVYELDVHAVARSLGILGTDGDPSFYIYDEDKNLLFSNLYSGESAPVNWNDSSAFVSQGNLSASEDLTQGYYRYSNSESGWIYLMPMDSAQLKVSLLDLLLAYIPAAILLFIFSSAFALYISRSIYRPINRLLNMVTRSATTRERQDQVDVDFLESAFSDVMEEQERLAGVMKNIGPEILNSMLTNLVNGKDLSRQRVEEILEGVGNPIRVEGRFVTLACEIQGPTDRPLADAELNLYLLAIRNLTESMCTDELHVYDMRTDKMALAIILCLSEQASAGAVKRHIVELEERLSHVTDGMPCRIVVEKSEIFHELPELRASYQEASERLHFLLYMSSDEESSDLEPETEQDSEAENYRLFYQEQLRGVIRTAQKDEATATEELRKIYLKVQTANASPASARQQIREILTQLTEKVISLPLSEEDLNLIEGQKQMPDSEEAFVLRVRMLVHMICVYSGRSRNRYVDQAREFIQDHYSDSNLSLNMIGDSIGISGAYLSELFSEGTGEKFSGYLAAFRVDKAKQLLRTTNVTIKEIGFLCGFNSVQNFIRVFKKYAGITPGQYREDPS